MMQGSLSRASELDREVGFRLVSGQKIKLSFAPGGGSPVGIQKTSETKRTESHSNNDMSVYLKMKDGDALTLHIFQTTLIVKTTFRSISKDSLYFESSITTTPPPFVHVVG